MPPDGEDEHSTIERSIAGSESEAALGRYVGQTDSPRLGERGTYQIKRANFDALESERVIGNVPDRETAERLTGNLAKAESFHRERTARARSVDEQKKAELTTSYEAWAANPRRLDFPGVDTPGVAGSYRDAAPRRPVAFDWGAPTPIGGTGPGEYEYAALEDVDRARLAREDADEVNQAGRATPGVGTIEADDEAAWERGDYGVGTLEQDDVTNWETEALFDFRDRHFEGHEKARKGLRARGVRPGKTDYSDDELMKDYLSDIRAIERELYDRGAMG